MFGEGRKGNIGRFGALSKAAKIPKKIGGIFGGGLHPGPVSAGHGESNYKKQAYFEMALYLETM